MLFARRYTAGTNVLISKDHETVTQEPILPPTKTARDKLPFVVPLLAVGTFLMCTTEYIVAGLLPEIAADYDVSLAQVGLLITVFALGMIVGAPVMAVATLRLPRRLTLVLALLVFAGGHVVAALGESFELALTARVVTALATGAFWSVASVVAMTAAGPALSSRALGVMMSGVGLATVAGVPLGAFAGQLIGWRGTFWALAVLAAIAAIVIGRSAPADDSRTAPSVASELSALRSGRLWLLVAATAAVTGGVMAAFSYISPLLTDRTGLPAWAVPVVLVGYGVGSLIGTNIGGRLGDRHPVRTFIGAAMVGTIVLALLIPLSVHPVATIVLVVVLGVAGMAVPPVATSLAMRFASQAPTLAAAIAVSAFNLGIALGSWIAGNTLESSLGPVGPEVVGAIMAALGLIPLALLARIRADRTPDALDSTSGEPALASAR
jgi:predicted MFS family arabinose efflux permease